MAKVAGDLDMYDLFFVSIIFIVFVYGANPCVV